MKLFNQTTNINSLIRLIKWSLLITLTFYTLSLLYISNHSLVAHDEAVYGSRARSILFNNEWFTPFDEPHHKTVGSYWLIAISLNILGNNELAARLPSYLSSLLSLLYTFKLTELIINKRSAYISVLVLCSMPLWFQYSHYASPDIPYIFFINLVDRVTHSY